MAFRFSRGNWLTSVQRGAGGWAKWLVAPAVIGVAAIAYLTKGGRRLKSTSALLEEPLPSNEPVEPSLPASAREHGEVIAVSTSLPQLEAPLGAADEIAIPSASMTPNHRVANFLPTEHPATLHEEIVPGAAPIAAPPPASEFSETWKLPAAVPLPVNELAPNRVERTRRFRAVAAIAAILITGLLVFAAVGAMRSYNAAAKSDSKMLQTTSATATPLPDVAAAPPIDPITLPVTPTTEPSPPAEGLTQPAASSSPSASPATKPQRMHHARSRHSRTVLGKTRAFLHKTF